jgi:hypothetical protein
VYCDVHPLLSRDRETSNETAAIARQQLLKYSIVPKPPIGNIFTKQWKTCWKRWFLCSPHRGCITSAAEIMTAVLVVKRRLLSQSTVAVWGTATVGKPSGKATFAVGSLYRRLVKAVTEDTCVCVCVCLCVCACVYNSGPWNLATICFKE